MVSGTGVLHVIEILSNSLLTNHLVLETPINQEVSVGPANDLAKLFVMERHGNHGNMGKGIVKGFKMKSGAVATTIAHDSHNIVVAGDNDADMLTAVRTLTDMGGGIVTVRGDNIMKLPLPIAGLLTSAEPKDVSAQLRDMLRLAHDELGIPAAVEPFMTLSFMTLPVIPELKLTARGLFDVTTFSFVTLEG